MRGSEASVEDSEIRACDLEWSGATVVQEVREQRIMEVGTTSSVLASEAPATFQITGTFRPKLGKRGLWCQRNLRLDSG